MGALIGGFALGNLTSHNLDKELFYDNMIYLLNVIAVHAGTCSALTSAFVYRHVNYMGEDGAVDFSKKWGILTKLPMAKFAIGCLAYMVSVLLLTYRNLVGAFQIISCLVGGMSILSVLVVGGLLATLEQPKAKV